MDFRRIPSGPLISILAAVFWIALAWRTPTSTHHFAPIVVGLMWGLAERTGSPAGVLDRSATVTAFAGGLGLALGSIAVLAAADKLQGPGLYGSFPVIPELVLHGVVGAVIGARPWTLATGGATPTASTTPGRSGRPKAGR